MFFKKMTHKGQKFEKWNVESVSDSPFSFFLPPHKVKTFLSCEIDKLLKTAHHFFAPCGELLMFT